MNMEMYSIRDIKTQLFSEPFFAQNRAAAIRRFDYIMKNAEMIAPDCELYYLGDFDSSKGQCAFCAPEFVKNAEVNE